MDDREPKDRKQFVTLVFEANVRDCDINPFDIETPYGKPCGVSIGDLMGECNRLEELLDENGIYHD